MASNVENVSIQKCHHGDHSTLVQVIACCYQAPSQCWMQCWPRSPLPYGITKNQWVNSLKPRQNGRHFADNTFKRIFLNENVRISIKISLKFVPKVPINNIPALVQVMAWCRPGDKPLTEPMVVRLLTHICVTRPQWVNGALSICVICNRCISLAEHIQIQILYCINSHLAGLRWLCHRAVITNNSCYSYSLLKDSILSCLPADNRFPLMSLSVATLYTSALGEVDL